MQAQPNPMYSRPSLSPGCCSAWSPVIGIYVLSSKLGIVGFPFSVHSQSRFLDPKPSKGSLCGVEGGRGLDKQGPEVESRGQIAGREGLRKLGLGPCSLAHVLRGLGLIPERWGAGGRSEDADGGAEGPISLPE